MKITSKKLKKRVDNRGRIWYSNKAVGAAGSCASGKRKKFLTATLECGNLKKLLRIRDGPDAKNFLKKFLTNGMKSSIIAMFRRERRAPCKLNNVTKRKHQKVIPFRWYDQRTKPFSRVESITGGMGK